jgi:hypothetical protein
VDSAAPVTAILSPAANAFIGNSVTVIITAEDPQPGTGIAEVTVWAEGGAPVLAQPSGHPNEYMATLDLNQAPQGSLAIYVQAKDILGNARTQSVTAIHDHTPPQIIVSYPAQNPYATFVPQQFINASVGDALSGLKSFTCVIPNNTCNIQVINQASRYITFSAPLSQGQNTVTLTAEDKAGNTTELDVVFIIDTTPPVISQLNPAHQSYLNDPQASGSAIIEDPESGINPGSIVVTLNGSLVSHSFDAVTGSLTFTPPPALSDGQYDLTVRAANAVGKETSVTHRYYLDTVAPAGPMNPQAWPQEGVAGEFDGDGTVFLTWEAAQDDNGGSGVAGYYAGIGGSMDFIDAANPLKHQTTTTQTGLVSYCVHAVDKAGNVSGTECDTISVAASGLVAGEITDSPDPISPKNVGTQPTNDSSTIQARIFGQGLTSWIVEIYGPGASSVPVIVLPVPGPGVSDSVSVEWDGKNSSGQFVDDGTYTYRIVPQGTNPEPPIIGQGTVTVDNTYPESLIVNLTDGAKLTETSYTVEVRVIENVAVESVRLIVDGSERTPCALDHTDTGGNPVYVCLWAVSQEGAGWHTVAARVTDTARNTKDSPSLNIQKPQMPVPEVTITSPAPDAPVRGQSVVTVHFMLKQGKVRQLDLFISADGTNYTPAAPAFNLSMPYPSSGDHSFTIDTTAYSDGYYYVKAEAHKSASQSAESVPVRILIDNTRVSVSDFIPGKGTRISPQSTPVNVIVTASVSDTGSGVSHAMLSVNGGPDLPVQIKDIFGTLKVVKQLLNQSYGNYALALKVYDKAGNVTVVDDWTFVIAPKPVIHSICPISGPPGSTVTITGENFTGDVSSLNVMAGYVSMPGPVMDFEQASIISMDQSTIVAQLPQGLRVSDPLAAFGLARIYVDAGGQITSSKLFQVTENAFDPTTLIYILNRDSSTISIIDSSVMKNVGTITEGLEGLPLKDAVLSIDGSHIFALTGGESIPESEQTIAVVDTACHSVISRVPGVQGADLLLSPDGAWLYSWNGSSVSVINTLNAINDAANAVATRTPIGTTPGLESMFAPDSRDIYSRTDSVTKIDDDKIVQDPYNAVLQTIVTTTTENPGNVAAMDFTPDGKHLVAYHSNIDLLTLYSLTEQQQTAVYPIEQVNRLRVHPDGRYLYISTQDDKIKVLDINLILAGEPDNAAVAEITIPGNPSAIEFSPDGTQVYVLGPNANVQPDPNAPVRQLDVLNILSHQNLISAQSAPLLAEIVSGDLPVAIVPQPLPAPSIAYISPAQGYAGELITLQGEHFGNIAANNHVLFHGVPGEVITAAPNEITVKTPAGATDGPVIVSVAARQSNAVSFQALPPQISSLLPDNGVAGAEVVVSGIGFSSVPDENTVTFRGVRADVLNAAADALTVRVPAYAQTGDVVVNVGGKSSNGLLFTVPGPSLHITDPLNAAVISEVQDSDVIALNGVQINVTVETDYQGEARIALQVGDQPSIKMYPILGEAKFENATLYPGENTLKAWLTDTWEDAYAEHSVVVVLDTAFENGDELVFTCTGDCGTGQAQEATSLFVKQMPNGSVSMLENTDNAIMASWRSDAMMLVYTAPKIPGSLEFVLYTYDMTTRTPQMLTTASGEPIPAQYPAWSADGRFIAYFHDRDSIGRASVSVISLDPQGQRISGPEIVTQDASMLFSNPRPIWSPNSRYLFLPASQADSGMKMITLQGSNPITWQSYNTGVSAAGYDWVPGTELISTTTGSAAAYMPLLTPLPIPIYESLTGEQIIDVTVSPDHTKLVYSAMQNQPQGGLSAGSMYYDAVTGLRQPIVNSGVALYPDWRVTEFVVHNSTPPSFKDFSPERYDQVNDSTPTIAGTLDTAVSRFACGVTPSLVVNGEDVTAYIQYNEFTGRVKYTPAQPFNPGQVVVAKFQAVDCVGLQGESILLFALNVPPAISELSPRPDGATNERTVRVAAKLQDVEGFDPQSVILNIDEIGQNIGTFNVYNNEVSYISELPEGLYHASVAATDIFGASVTDSWSFIVDRTPPYIVSEKYPSDTYYKTGSRLTTIGAVWTDGINGSGLIADPDMFYMYKHLVPDPIKQMLPTMISQESPASWRLEYALSPNDTSLDGESQVYMYAIDRAGNINNSEYWSLSVDFDSPDIIPIYPIANLVIKGIGTENPIIVKLRDSLAGVSAESIEFSIWDNFDNQICVDTVDTPNCACQYIGANTLISKEITLKCFYPLQSNGEYRIFIKASDAVGHIASIGFDQVPPLTFTVDNSITEEQIPAIRYFRISPIAPIVNSLPRLNLRIGNRLLDIIQSESIRITVKLIETGDLLCESTYDINGCDCVIDVSHDNISCDFDPQNTVGSGNYYINVFALDINNNAYSRTWDFHYNSSIPESTPIDDIVLSDIVPRQIDANASMPMGITYWLDAPSDISLSITSLGPLLESNQQDIRTTNSLLPDHSQSKGFHFIVPIMPVDDDGEILESGAYKFEMSATLDSSICSQKCPTTTLADDFTGKPQIKDFTFESSLNPVLNQPLELGLTLKEPGQILFRVGIKDGPLVAEPEYWSNYISGQHIITWDGRAEGTPYILSPGRYFYIVYQLSLFDNAFIVYGKDNDIVVNNTGPISINPDNLSPVSIKFTTLSDSKVTAVLLNDESTWDSPLAVLLDDQIVNSGSDGLLQWNGEIDSIIAEKGLYTIALQAESVSDPGRYTERRHITVGVQSPIMKVKDGVLYIAPNPGEIVYNITQTDDNASPIVTLLAERTIPEGIIKIPIRFFSAGEHTFTATFLNINSNGQPYTKSVSSTYYGGDTQ